MNKEETRVQARPIFKCPYCGWEYLPEEIFLPADLIGKTKNIIKDPLGKIIYADYKEDEEPEYTVKYICDHCDMPFKAEMTLTGKTVKEEEELNFQKQAVSLFD